MMRMTVGNAFFNNCIDALHQEQLEKRPCGDRGWRCRGLQACVEAAFSATSKQEDSAGDNSPWSAGCQQLGLKNQPHCVCKVSFLSRDRNYLCFFLHPPKPSSAAMVPQLFIFLSQDLKKEKKKKKRNWPFNWIEKNKLKIVEEKIDIEFCLKGRIRLDFKLYSLNQFLRCMMNMFWCDLENKDK